jgi:hypothetical protein
MIACVKTATSSECRRKGLRTLCASKLFQEFTANECNATRIQSAHTPRKHLNFLSGLGCRNLASGVRE